MNTNLRPGRREDAQKLGSICYEAFRQIAEEHNFPPDLSSQEQAIGFLEMLLSRPDVYSSVAEVDGSIAGSNFLWEGDQVSGVGPITIDPALQNGAVGRKLMEDVIRRSDEKGFLSVRLVQAAYHNRSLALYTKLGFNSVEPLSVIQGPKINASFAGLNVRPMTQADIDAADRVCIAVHGISRRNEIAGSAAMGTGQVAEYDGRITGYSTVLAFFGHAVGETNRDLMALIAAADEFGGPGFLLPTRNSEVMRWCLENGLKIVQPLTLMSRGVYQEPRGAFLPSILY
jgi:GNAT superfamily N-acetyltransferase